MNLELWKKIKPGDIAITIITSTDDEVSTHIEIVVGWGPPAPEFEEYKQAVRMGHNFYPTYDEERSTYVPYVMDRFSLPGTGNTTGPRPFNQGLIHTSVAFWVARPATSPAP